MNLYKKIEKLYQKNSQEKSSQNVENDIERLEEMIVKNKYNICDIKNTFIEMIFILEKEGVINDKISQKLKMIFNDTKEK